MRERRDKQNQKPGVTLPNLAEDEGREGSESE